VIAQGERTAVAEADAATAKTVSGETAALEPIPLKTTGPIAVNGSPGTTSPVVQTLAEGQAPIARIAPGSLPAAEEASLLRTVSQIDAGTKPGGSLSNKWGTKFKNWDGDLPGARGDASPYREYRVAPPAGTSSAGPLRVVVNHVTGEMYYTWTHYGDSGAPAFVKIR